MCGFTGIINLNTENVPKSLLEQLLFPIKHRGPDASGMFFHKNVGLAHAKLSIRDKSELANQPFISDCKNYILCFNGEIFNCDEIKKLLPQKLPFKTTTDTEILLYALIHIGESVISKLNGMFAFAFFNIKKNEMLLARDPLGIKPLYIYQKDNMFAFSSEIKSFYKLPYFDKSISINSKEEYDTFGWALKTNTLFKFVERLAHGSYMNINTENFKIIKNNYYTTHFSNKHASKNENELILALENLLIDAVKKQLIGDVKIGFFLSGGLDSSLIAAIAQKHCNEPINCFTLDTTPFQYKKHGFDDDLMYAKKVAKHINCKLEIVTASTVNNADIKKIAWHLDEPLADTASLNTFAIAEKASKLGIKVLIGGTGADDIFAGYRRHQVISKISLFKKLAFLSPIINKASIIKSKSISRLNHVLTNITLSTNDFLTSLYVLKSLNFTVVKKTSLATIYNLISLFEDLDKNNISSLNKLLYIEQNCYLPNNNLLYLDKMTMAHGIEARVPFLDIRLIEFANKLTTNQKIKHLTTKYLLKKIALKYLPKDVVYRKKTGFGQPTIETHNVDKHFQLLLMEALKTSFF